MNKNHTAQASLAKPENDSLPAGVQLQEVQRIVADFPFVVPLPGPLRRMFAQQRQQEFERVIKVGAPAAVAFCLLILFAGQYGFGNELAGDEGQLWWWTALANTGTVMMAAICFQFQRWRARYQGLLGTVGVFIMINVMLLSIVLTSPRLAQTMTYVVMLLITIVTLALRLSVITAAVSCALGGVVGIGSALVMGYKLDWWLLFFYFFGSLSVSLFVAWMLERQERVSFLKSLLLNYESTERERLNRELARLARQDALTGLANRRSFDERLVQEWERSQRGRHELALIFIDVDHFKLYNDTYGHSAGDDCLAAVAGAIHSCMFRPADLASRYGGEEFVVLLPETTVEGAREVAERIQEAVDKLNMPHAASPTAGHVTISMGLTSCVPQSGLAQALVDAADSALYQAKHAGRHRIVSTSPDNYAVAAS
ncbi:MAG: diguanylate cyclase [Pedobacter sp.]|nr:diguanylate cyclase [Pedobacter sp.]